jgi:predicted nucleic acid-binding protein
MDVLQPDGSIRWSSAHRDLFTPERTGAEVGAALAQRQGLTLQIDEVAVAALDRLLALLRERSVRVVLIHPPFNPDFYRQVKETAYGAGLLRVEAVTARLAAAHGATVVGSFDPAVAGCSAAMFIDAEHSGPACLRRLIDLVPGL